MSTDDPAKARWRFHPVGLLATIQRNLVDGLIGFLIGLGLLFAVVLVCGLLAEEVLAETIVGTTLDLLSRASMGGAMGLGVIALLLLGMSFAFHGPLMARALATRARDGAAKTDVPAPDQWESAQGDTSGLYTGIAVVLLCVLGVLYAGVVWAFLSSDPDATGLAIAGGGALLLGAIAGGIPLARNILPRRQAGFQRAIEEHWSAPYRKVADRQELTPDEVDAIRWGAGGHGAAPGHGLRRLGNILLAVAGPALAIALIALQLMFVVAYPEVERWSGGQLGDRADLEPEGERLVDLVVIVFALSAAIALLAALLAAVCEILAHRETARALRALLTDPAAAPPPYEHLVEVIERRPVPVVLAFAALSGMLAALGFGLWFVDLVADQPDWDLYATAGPELRAAGALGPWIMLAAVVGGLVVVLLSSVLDARDRALRDELVQRWPVRPPVPTKAPEDAART